MPLYQGTAGADAIDQAKLGLPDWSDIQGLAGNDTITGGNVRIDGGAGDDLITAATPFTTVVYWSSPTGIQGDLITGIVQDGWGGRDQMVSVHVFQGSGYSDSFYGSHSPDEFWAGPGDMFDGRGGADRLVIWDYSNLWTWSWISDDTLRLFKASTGDSVLGKNIEFLKFNDRSLTVSSQYQVAQVFSDPIAIYPLNSFLTITGVDANRDGRMDILVSAGVSPPGGAIQSPPRLLIQQANGGFTEAMISGTVEGFVHPREIAQGDFNGDGYTDFVIVGHGYDTAPFPGETATVWISDGKGGWTDRSEWMPAVNAFTHSVATGDVNKDGKDDIFLGNIWGQNSVTPKLLLSQNNGFREISLPSRIGSNALRDSGIAPIASLLIDVNADGLLDLIAGGGPNGVSIFFGRRTISPDGPFFSDVGSSLPVGIFGDRKTITVDIASADFNHDGRSDLLLSQTGEDPFYSGRGLQLLIQQPDGGFVDETSIRFPGFDRASQWATFIQLVDLNGDGLLDVLLNGTSETDPIAYLDNGSGVFRANDGTRGLPQVLSANLIADGTGKVFLVQQRDGKISVDVVTYDPQKARSVIGTNSSDTLIGAGGSDTLLAGAGDDNVNGGVGDDILDGGLGSDTVFGGAGNDIYYVDDAGDSVVELSGEGTDTEIASLSVYLPANLENLTLTSTAYFGVGNALDNVIVGSNAGNLLLGGAGNDTIRGGDARDAIFGESGNDSISGSGGIDYIVAGTGNDTVEGGDGADEIYGEDGNDSISGGSDFQTDILVGGAGSDTINGGPAWDLMYGNSGDDTFYASQQADWVFENANEGYDTVIADSPNGYYLFANIEALMLIGTTPFGVGNELDNLIVGNAIGNVLLGGAGNDTLDGGAGQDILWGEAGADTFLIRKGTGIDIIADFTPGTDYLDVRDYGFKTTAALMSRMTQVGADISVDLGGGDSLILMGVKTTSLGAADLFVV